MLAETAMNGGMICAMYDVYMHPSPFCMSSVSGRSRVTKARTVATAGSAGVARAALGSTRSGSSLRQGPTGADVGCFLRRRSTLYPPAHLDQTD